MRLLLSLAVLFAGSFAAFAQSTPNFNREIRPVLARSCFPCHGPDEEERQADLRLDVRDEAVKAGAFRVDAYEESELLLRVFSPDPDTRMPPADSGHQLTATQKELLRKWVLAGAKYEKHWSFIPPKRPAIPKVRNTKWVRNEIDRFLLARLEQEGLTPATEADRTALVRRVYLDLIGLPPTPEQAAEFVQNDDPGAYGKLVDRLLASKHYGERWGRLWLDLARYSDTNGYEKDRPRSIWPYRDWVINALNDDMPFDQFTIEQLAGDMLPGATVSQRIATGFHRNTMLNEEGGIDPSEYRFYAMVDRVATTGAVWLGLTTGCAQCHTHKYDPITHTDYYRLFALLNNADEPDLTVPDAAIEKRRASVEAQIEAEIAALPAKFPPEPGEGSDEELRQSHFHVRFEKWLNEERSRAVRWHVVRPWHFKGDQARLEVLPDGSVFASGDANKVEVYELGFHLDQQEGLDASRALTGIRLEVLPDDRLPAGGPGRAFYEGRKGDFFLSELTLTAGVDKQAFQSGSVSFGKLSIGSGTAEAENVFDGKGSTGWSTSTRPGEPHQLVLTLEPVIAQSISLGMLFERHFAASLGRFRFSITFDEGPVVASRIPADLEAALAEADSLDPGTLAKLKRQFLLTTPLLTEARKKLDGLRKQLPELPHTMVFRERPADFPRPTFRHHRGEYLSPRERVEPALPSLFSNFENGVEPNRLNFARWLVSEKNPLVARVTVNRAWRAFFGIGLVETSADFGTQSNPPSHPELLDWLAVEFMANGWSIKKLHRLIVTSAAYRQSSRLSPELLKRDPRNRLLARGPRFRVDAETVRDIMLSSSSLLSTKFGGPSVYPPQPASVTALAYGGAKWPVSKGEDRYRRSLYTFNKRTAPYAAYTVFDGPTGENCLPRRNRSNTPLQALTLLNDEMFLEMARALGRTAENREGDVKEKAKWIFQSLVTRAPRESELASLVSYVEAQQKRIEAKEIAAERIGGAGASSRAAAFSMLARSLMNLDEVITKQ